MRTLVLHLAADPLTDSRWALFQGPGAAPLRAGDVGADTALPQDLFPDRVWVVVPGVDVVLRHVALPQGARPRHARAGAAFALEEELAADPEVLHFALGDETQTNAAERPVAVVAVSTLSAWLARLAAWRVRPDVLVPDYLALNPGLAAVGGMIVARTEAGGFAAEPEMLDWLLDSPSAPRAVSAQTFLQEAYAVLQETPVINLLQDRFAPRRDWAGLLRPWRRAGGIAAALVLASVLGVIIEGARLNHQADAATARAEAVFRAALPEVTRVVNPRAQMRAHLQNTVLTGEGGFLALSDVIVAAIAAVDGAEVAALRFDGRRGEMAATVSLPTFDALEQLKSVMTARGASVQEGGARQDGGRILTDMTVRLP